MSRTETDVFNYPCPCGAGKIEKTVVSTDYIFSSAHVTYQFLCTECTKVWRLDAGELVLKESERPYLEARAAEREIAKEFRKCLNDIVERYFQERHLSNKRAEHDHLVATNLYQKTYATYAKHRNKGTSIRKIVMQEDPVSWIKSIAQALGFSEKLRELELAKSKRAHLSAEAEKLIVRRSL